MSVELLPCRDDSTESRLRERNVHGCPLPGPFSVIVWLATPFQSRIAAVLLSEHANVAHDLRRSIGDGDGIPKVDRGVCGNQLLRPRPRQVTF